MGTTPGRQSDFFWTATCWFWFKVEPNLLVHMFSIFQHVTTLHKFQQRNSVLHCFNLFYRVWESSKEGKAETSHWIHWQSDTLMAWLVTSSISSSENGPRCLVLQGSADQTQFHPAVSAQKVTTVESLATSLMTVATFLCWNLSGNINCLAGSRAQWKYVVT